jgi:hypothetical protein
MTLSSTTPHSSLRESQSDVHSPSPILEFVQAIDELEDNSFSSVSHSSIHIPTPQHEAQEQEMEEGAIEVLQEEEET